MRSYLSRQDVVYLAISAALLIAYTVAVFAFDADAHPWDWVR